MSDQLLSLINISGSGDGEDLDDQKIKQATANGKVQVEQFNAVILSSKSFCHIYRFQIALRNFVKYLRN